MSSGLAHGSKPCSNEYQTEPVNFFRYQTNLTFSTFALGNKASVSIVCSSGFKFPVNVGGVPARCPPLRVPSIGGHWHGRVVDDPNCFAWENEMYVPRWIWNMEYVDEGIADIASEMLIWKRTRAKIFPFQSASSKDLAPGPASGSASEISIKCNVFLLTQHTQHHARIFLLTQHTQHHAKRKHQHGIPTRGREPPTSEYPRSNIAFKVLSL